MHLPPNVATPHSCEQCAGIVLDPNAKGFIDVQSKQQSKWVPFDPAQTVGSFRKMHQQRCLFGSLITSMGETQDPMDPVLYRFTLLPGGRAGFGSILFGIPTAADAKGSLKTDEVKIVQDQTCTLVTTQDDPAVEIIPRRPINTDPNSDASFGMARHWLRTCLETHTSCPKLNCTFLPKRVITVEKKGISGFELHLVETEGLTMEPYCALSYCWGGDQQVKTDASTYRQFRDKGIVFDELPATLRDAVTTTHELGIHYLFVDALCILQDSNDDKQKQIAQMPEIYSEATVVIIASRASAVTEGFLHRRPASFPKDGLDCENMIKMAVLTPSGKTGSVIVVKSKIGSATSYARGPISTRAWVMQEQLLARRSLVYDPVQTVWRCWTTNGEFSDGWLIDMADGNDKYPYYVPSLLRISPSTKADATTLTNTDTIQQWHELVQNYTERNLSFAGDKLLAISALAQRVSVVLGKDDMYLAGIWKSRLLEDLSWFVLWQRHPRPTTGKAPAPSWSWAAVQGRIYAYTYNKAPCSIELVACHTRLVDTDCPFGAVTGGELVLRGRLRHMCFIDMVTDLSGLFRTMHYGLCCVRMRESLTSVTKGQKAIGTMIMIAMDAIEPEFATKKPGSNFDVALLPLRGHGSKECIGLVLRNIGGQRFSRIGLFRYPPNNSRYSKEDLVAGKNLHWGDSLGVQAVSYQDWAEGFDDCPVTEVTIV